MMMRNTILERAIQRLRQPVVRHAAISLLVSGCIFSGAAMSNPDAPTVVAGNANFEQLGNQLSITNSPGTIINWNGFSIDRNEITRFLQQNDQSAVLNRVTGGSISNILGELMSNGRVFLVNPNGIVIGNGARIDTAGFVGSSLNITDDDFLNGRYSFKGDSGTVVNNGTITAGPGGEIILIAPTVENSGDITVTEGEIILAAGREVTLTSLDDANISFRVSAPGDKALNIGSLTASNGAIGVFANQVKSSGNVSANRVSTNARGQIVLQADTDTEVSGMISATGNGVTGGEVTILGDDIRLVSAEIDVTGTNGGTVLVGGEFQGNGDLQRANRTDIDQNSVIHADALEQGNGGEIIVWSEQATNSQGRLTARGGNVSGDGGLVETSSRGNLQFGQPADVSAANGNPGTWLLDPEDIVIDSAYADSISSALNGGSNVQVKTAETGTGEGNITVNAPIRKTEGPDAALGLIAHNRIDVNAPIESVSGKLSVSLRAGRDIDINAAINTNGGSYSANIVPSLLPAEPEPSEESDEEVSETEAPVEATEETANEIAEETAEDVIPETETVSTEPIEPVDTIETPTGVSDGVSEELSSTPTNIIELNESGISVDAAVSSGGGNIEINAGESGLLSINDTVTSSGSNAGDIQLLGEQIALYNSAIVDASSTSGGGEILIGGGQQGLDPNIPNSNAVYIAPSARVSADGIDDSDGGRVIIFAESVANIDGDISARGGENGGDGGFVETSGRNNLRISKAPNVSATNGNGGSWLIDPSSIDIVDDSTSTNIDPGATGTEFTTIGDSVSSRLSVTELANALRQNANVQVVTSGLGNGTGNINLLAELNTDPFVTAVGEAGSLTLSAHNDINILNSIVGTDDFRLAALTLIANSDGVNGGDVNIDATGKGSSLEIETRGDFTIRADNFTATGGADDGGEDVSITIGGGFQFDIEDNIELVSNGFFSAVELESTSTDPGSTSIQAQNMTLRTVGNGTSRILARNTPSPAVFPIPSYGEIRIADTLTLDGGRISGFFDVFTNDLDWNNGDLVFNSLDTTGLVTLDDPGFVSINGDWNIGSGATVNWNDGTLFLSGEVNNAGTFNANSDDTAATGDGDFPTFAEFNNSGRFVKTTACGANCGATAFASTGGPMNFNNTGEVVIQAGDLLIIQRERETQTGGTELIGGYTQSAGSTTLRGGNLVAEAFPSSNTQPPRLPGILQFNGGVLAGGVNNTSVTNGGTITGVTEVDGATIAAGFSPGTLTFDGDLTVSNTSSIAVELASTSSGDFDVINVTGNATLDDPTINVAFLGYSPPNTIGVTDNFDIINAQNLVTTPSANAIQVNQPVNLPANVVSSSGRRGNSFFLSYLRVPPTDGPGDTPTPMDNPNIPEVVVRTFDPVPTDRIPRVPMRPKPETTEMTPPFDPITPIISLVEQVPNPNESDDGPEFLQCY